MDGQTDIQTGWMEGGLAGGLERLAIKLFGNKYVVWMTGQMDGLLNGCLDGWIFVQNPYQGTPSTRAQVGCTSVY